MFRKILTGTLLFTFLLGIAAFGAQSSDSRPAPVMIVDINSAPLEEIEEVVRDEDLAKRIIDNRPYANKRQLVSRQLMSLEDYDEIKDRIIARRIQDPAVEDGR